MNSQDDFYKDAGDSGLPLISCHEMATRCLLPLPYGATRFTLGTSLCEDQVTNRLGLFKIESEAGSLTFMKEHLENVLMPKLTSLEIHLPPLICKNRFDFMCSIYLEKPNVYDQREEIQFRIISNKVVRRFRYRIHHLTIIESAKEWEQRIVKQLNEAGQMTWRGPQELEKIDY